MLELRLVQGSLLKKVLESIKELVTDANFHCSPTAFSLQALDSSHVAMVALLLRSEGFDHYLCDRNISMGMNLDNVAKMLKFAGHDDIITLKKADHATDSLTFIFQSPTQDKTSKFEMKQMDIESEHLGMPEEAEYHAIVRMPSPDDATVIEMNEPVSLRFALRYLISFTKATPLSSTVTLSLSSELPLVVEYKIAEMGYIRFYLSAKFEED